MREAIQTLEAKIRDLKIVEAKEISAERAKLEQWERAKGDRFATTAQIAELEAGLRKLRMPTVSSLEGMEALNDSLGDSGD